LGWVGWGRVGSASIEMARMVRGKQVRSFQGHRHRHRHAFGFLRAGAVADPVAGAVEDESAAAEVATKARAKAAKAAKASKGERGGSGKRARDDDA